MRVVTTELDHVSLAVDDLDAAVGFYEAAFGFELSFRDTQTEAIVALTGVACAARSPSSCIRRVARRWSSSASTAPARAPRASVAGTSPCASAICRRRSPP
jgi:catechol 2,3-dioxygenase-like lactoylglutathione lyase family enzyme